MSIPFFLIEEAYLWASMSEPEMNHAWINRHNGQIYRTSAIGDSDEEPDDFDADHWVQLPYKRDLDLGKYLVFRFAETLTATQEADIKGFFRSKGAYRRFRGYLTQNGILESWYAFENAATDTALRAWTKENGISISPD